MTFWSNTTLTFFYHQIINKKNQTKNRHHATLQTNGLFKRAICTYSSLSSSYYEKRLCLCASKKLNANITIEASVCFPIFFLITMSLLYIINIMYLQTTLQIALEETVRNASKAAYITNEFYAMSAEDQQDVADKEPSIISKLGTSVLTSSYLHSSFLTEKNKELLDNSPIKNGSNGISFMESSIDLNNGTADIIMSYEVSIPFIPDKLLSFNLVNRCYIHLYTGLDMAREQTPDDFYVYYTVTGQVFHTYKYCRYLLNYTDAIPYLNISGIECPCKLCCKDTLETLQEENKIVYITENGAVFHTSLKCSSFTGNVFRVHYSSLDESDKICEQCLKGK